MNIKKCKAEIKRHEGEVLEIYVDSLGYKTLGVGHLCQPEDPEYNWEVGTAVPQEVVDMYYESDFDKHLKETMHVIGEEDFKNLPEIIQRVVVKSLLVSSAVEGFSIINNTFFKSSSHVLCS